MNQKHLQKISKKQHADLSFEICQLLALNDPLGLAFYDDCEYESEARDIAAKLPEVTSLKDVHDLIYDVFWDSFQPYRLAQEKQRYAESAKVIWKRWREHLETGK